MTSSGQSGDPGPRRSTARLAAVQALYEIELTGIPTKSVLNDFLAKRWNISDDDEAGNKDAPEAALAEPDGELLAELVGGAGGRFDELDRLIKPALSGGWSEERLEALVRAILRAGVYELLALPDIPARTIISEYVDVAKAFYTGAETGLVNGVLDTIARDLRAGEMADAG